MDLDRTWVLVVDPLRARIVRRSGAEGIPGYDRSDLVIRRSCARHLATVPRGRLPKEAARGAHASPTREEEMGTFVETVVHFLDVHRISGDFEALVVFADEKLLRRLRLVMPPALHRRIVAMIPANVYHRLDGEWWRRFEAPRPVLN